MEMCGLFAIKKIFEWNERSSHFEPVPDADEVQYKGLNWDGTGFWGMRGRKLYCFSHGNLSVLEVPDYLPLANIKKVAVGRDGAIWLGVSGDRIARFFKGKWQVDSKPFESSFQDSDKGSRKVRIDSYLDRTVFFRSEGFEKGIHYNTIIEDDEHNVWIGIRR